MRNRKLIATLMLVWSCMPALTGDGNSSKLQQLRQTDVADTVTIESILDDLLASDKREWCEGVKIVADNSLAMGETDQATRWLLRAVRVCSVKNDALWRLGFLVAQEPRLCPEALGVYPVVDGGRAAENLDGIRGTLILQLACGGAGDKTLAAKAGAVLAEAFFGEKGEELTEYATRLVWADAYWRAKQNPQSKVSVYEALDELTVEQSRVEAVVESRVAKDKPIDVGVDAFGLVLALYRVQPFDDISSQAREVMRTILSRRREDEDSNEMRRILEDVRAGLHLGPVDASVVP